jgi:nucleoid DNA-binding protein
MRILNRFTFNSERVKMNKSELVKRVAEKLDNLPKKIAAKAVDAVFQSIQEGLEEDGIVKIGQWGTYTVDDLE